MPTQKVKREIIVASPDTCEGGDTDSERALYGKAFLKRLERNKFSKQLIQVMATCPDGILTSLFLRKH